jgi:hypothetical protein
MRARPITAVINPIMNQLGVKEGPKAAHINSTPNKIRTAPMI